MTAAEKTTDTRTAKRRYLYRDGWQNFYRPGDMYTTSRATYLVIDNLHDVVKDRARIEVRPEPLAPNEIDFMCDPGTREFAGRHILNCYLKSIGEEERLS